MSRHILVEGSEPSSPSATQHALYIDSADGRLKQKDSVGRVSVITPDYNPNVLVNGGFNFAQRQAPGTLTTYSNTSGRSYGADRWGMTNENASIQYQRIDTNTAPETGLQARFYGKFKKLTSAGKMEISQVIEGSDVMQLRGQYVIMSVKAKYSVAASMAIRLGLVQLGSAGTIDSIPATFISAHGAVGTDPTLGTNLAYIAPTRTGGGGTINGNAVDIALTSGWVRYWAVFLVPSNCKNLVAMIWTNGQPAANDELNVSEWGLYAGQETVDWVRYPYPLELARCQRFYCKTFAVDTAPAQNIGINTGEAMGVAGKAGAVANAGMIPWRFPVGMRGTPATNTTYNPAAADAQVRDETASVSHSASAVGGANETSLYVNSTGNASTAVGDRIGVHISADAEL